VPTFIHPFARRASGRFTVLLTFLGSLLLLPSALGGTLGIGDAIPPFTVTDQYGHAYTWTPGPRYLLVGFDMNASKLANHQLAGQGSGWLEKHHALYLLDIHTMRQYPQRILLAETDTLLTSFPHQPERLTILVLNPDGKIQAIRYWNPAAESPGPILP